MPASPDAPSPAAGLVQMQEHQAKEAVSSHISSHMLGTQAASTAPNSRIQTVVPDRDRRMRDASALAFDATALRPATATASNRSLSVYTGVSSSPSESPRLSTGHRTLNRPTSAGGPNQAYGATFSREERKAISNLTQIGDDIEEECQYQSQVGVFDA